MVGTTIVLVEEPGTRIMHAQGMYNLRGAISIADRALGRQLILWFASWISFASPVATADALTIEVDYRYDQNGFFSAGGNPQGAVGASAARAAIEAAAARWGAIIDQPLLAAQFNDAGNDPRIRFIHPGTGQPHEVSSAASVATDALVRNGGALADEYRGSWSLSADTIVIYAGAHLFGDGGNDVEQIGNGSTGFGENFVDVIGNPNGPIFRGFPQPFPNGPRDNLPVWGGAVSFTTHPNAEWYFDHTALPPTNSIDLYSIALHEIGHVLGQNTLEWNNWSGYVSGFEFRGPETLAAVAAGGVAGVIPEVNDGNDFHWFAGTADSLIFRAGAPNYLGTVGPVDMQISLMHGELAFAPPTLRYEVTNLDAASLRDVGWSTLDGDLPLPEILEIREFEIDAVLVGGAPRLAWLAEPGARFTVMSSRNLRDWKAVTPDVVSKGEMATYQDGDAGFNDPNPPAGESEEKYYRVISRSFKSPPLGQ
ncbi:MAG: hypothetical protein ACI8XO_000489 [Verrucomicrobiales bacterium]|jgi:hypothetical protein